MNQEHGENGPVSLHAEKKILEISDENSEEVQLDPFLETHNNSDVQGRPDVKDAMLQATEEETSTPQSSIEETAVTTHVVEESSHAADDNDEFVSVSPEAAPDPTPTVEETSMLVIPSGLSFDIPPPTSSSPTKQRGGSKRPREEEIIVVNGNSEWEEYLMSSPPLAFDGGEKRPRLAEPGSASSSSSTAGDINKEPEKAAVDAEFVGRETEFDRDTEIVKGDTEIVKGDIVKGDTEKIVKGDTENVKGDTEFVKGDTEIVKGDTEIVKGDDTKHLTPSVPEEQSSSSSSEDENRRKVRALLKGIRLKERLERLAQERVIATSDDLMSPSPSELLPRWCLSLRQYRGIGFLRAIRDRDSESVTRFLSMTDFAHEIINDPIRGLMPIVHAFIHLDLTVLFLLLTIQSPRLQLTQLLSSSSTTSSPAVSPSPPPGGMAPSCHPVVSPDSDVSPSDNDMYSFPRFDSRYDSTTPAVFLLLKRLGISRSHNFEILVAFSILLYHRLAALNIPIRPIEQISEAVGSIPLDEMAAATMFECVCDINCHHDSAWFENPDLSEIVCAWSWIYHHLCVRLGPRLHSYTTLQRRFPENHHCANFVNQKIEPGRLCLSLLDFRNLFDYYNSTIFARIVSTGKISLPIVRLLLICDAGDILHTDFSQETALHAAIRVGDAAGETFQTLLTHLPIRSQQQIPPPRNNRSKNDEDSKLVEEGNLLGGEGGATTNHELVEPIEETREKTIEETRENGMIEETRENGMIEETRENGMIEETRENGMIEETRKEEAVLLPESIGVSLTSLCVRRAAWPHLVHLLRFLNNSNSAYSSTEPSAAIERLLTAVYTSAREWATKLGYTRELGQLISNDYSMLSNLVPGPIDGYSSTALFTHSDCQLHYREPWLEAHDLGLASRLYEKWTAQFPENPKRLEVLTSPENGVLRLDRLSTTFSSWDESSPPLLITDALRVHDWTYLSEVKRRCHMARLKLLSHSELTPYDCMRLDADTQLTSGSLDAALAAAGSVVAAVRAVCEGAVNNAFCAIRPPGHHVGTFGAIQPSAGGDRDLNDVMQSDEAVGSQGFCILNNVAVGAAYAKYHYGGIGIRRIAIIDFDVHHGNGTEQIVRSLNPRKRIIQKSAGIQWGENLEVTYSSEYWKPWRDCDDFNDIMFISLHGAGGSFYPSTGFHSPEGLPRVINVPYSAQDDTTCKSLVDHQVIPPLALFKPDLLFLSAGFDGHCADGLAEGFSKWNESDFEYLTERLVCVANTYCDGRIISVLEGGYNTGLGIASPFARSVLSHVEALHLTSPQWALEETAADEFHGDTTEVLGEEEDDGGDIVLDRRGENKDDMVDDNMSALVSSVGEGRLIEGPSETAAVCWSDSKGDGIESGHDNDSDNSSNSSNSSDSSNESSQSDISSEEESESDDEDDSSTTALLQS